MRLWEREMANLLESRTLAVLSDAMLRKFLSGETRVKDAPKTVGAQQ
jgi:hypothetical protein